MPLGGQHTAKRKVPLFAALLCTVGTVATAQDSGGLNAQLNVSSGLTISDADETSLRSDLSFGITSETRTQTFAFRASSAVIADLDDTDNSRILNPGARLSYGAESRQLSLDTSLSYRQSEVGTIVETEIPGILVFDEGTRETVAANLGLTFGKEAPFGGDFSLSGQQVAYSDTTDPELIDTTTMSASVNFRFDIDRTTALTLGYSISDRDGETGRDVRTERLTAGANVAVTPTLDARFTVGLSEITATEAGAETVTDGLNYGLTLTQARPNGSIALGLQSSLSETGRRTTATLSRELETPGGTLAASFGLTEGADNEVRPLATLQYSNELARADYSVALNQAFATTSTGAEALNSRLIFNWRQDLNRTSRFGSDLSYQVTDVLGMDDDSERLEIGVSYSHDLTADWALTTRVSHAMTHADGSGTDRENELFLGFETTVGWRP